MFLHPVALLYYVCFLLLLGLSLFVLIRRPHSRSSRAFFLLALTLLAWQVTLFIETRITDSAVQLLLGRINFSAVAYSAYLALRLVEAIAENQPSTRRTGFRLLLTWLLALVTLLTPLICASERVEAGHAITTFGPLFWVYLLHVIGYLCAALVTAIRARRQATVWARRQQLTFIACGMLLTGGVSLITNALLPFVFDDFRFCDMGPLSTLFFVLAVAYAVFVHGLFDECLILRKTLIYGILLTFVLGAYSSGVFVATQYLTAQADASKIVQFVVLLIAFSVDPLRRFLETKTDRLLFGAQDEGDKPIRSRKRRHKRRDRQRTGLLALLFPWRRG